jgi:glycosyltransferase involved in cell wall biosynthesis
MAKVSVFVLTGNEELNIRRCLESVAGWSDDIHVVDSDSRDRTKEISREYTPHVVNHSYVDHASQLVWAFDNLPFKHDWILFLDADNIVTPELKSQIDEALASVPDTVSAYYSIHREYFRDREVRGMKKWWARLVRRGKVRVDNSELVDYGIEIDGEHRYLTGAIVEDNLKENDIDFWIDKHQRFAARMAAEEVLRKVGYLKWKVPAKLFGSSDGRRVWLKVKWIEMPLYWRVFPYWFYRFFLTGAVFQGMHGFTFIGLQAFWFRLIVDMKISEFERAMREGKLTVQDLVDKFGKKSLAGHVIGKIS